MGRLMGILLKHRILDEHITVAMLKAYEESNIEDGFENIEETYARLLCAAGIHWRDMYL